jgi:hypothetical protein
VSGWIQLDSLTAEPFMAFVDTLSRNVPRARRMAIVTNAVGGRFHVEPVRKLGADAAMLARVAGEVARRASSAGYRGLVLDLEALTAADLSLTQTVIRSLADSAHGRGLTPIAVAIPAVDTAAYPARAFIPSADQVLVMLYDQHWSTSSPGPIASPEWVRNALGLRFRSMVIGGPLLEAGRRDRQPLSASAKRCAMLQLPASHFNGIALLKHSPRVALVHGRFG